MSREQGFTLIEVLAALAIAAVALTALIGRLGASADVQRDLAMHAMMLDAGIDILQQALPGVTAGLQGEIEVNDVPLQWRKWSEKTALPGFVRSNVAISFPGQPELTLFLFQEAVGHAP